MAMWWLVNVSFPERTGVDILQIYADDAGSAIAGAKAWTGASSVTIRDSGPDRFSNPVITSGGIKDASSFEAGASAGGTGTGGTGGATRPPSDGYTGSHNPFGQYTQYGQGGGDTVPRQRQLDELGNFAGQFGNKFGIPAFGASPFQQWQSAQYAPTLAAFKLGSAANPDRTFDDYLGARGLMGAREDLGAGYESLLGSSNQGAASEARESIGEDAWNQLMAARLRAKRGLFFGPALARRLPALEQQYEASPEGFEAPDTYGFMRNILQRRFGI